ncbi:MAG TPA: hypothetical protein ENG63_09705 [Candidatus Desulfofervidus auxilii]|uniref:Uncharacterized protein n=1 Tax=Desulfofervidus auxilii TaxID=1621989 RepID=A0A7C0U436_DESA2|nr:hypothetical protein [Candidatus Desulfofervidus auxilii]
MAIARGGSVWNKRKLYKCPKCHKKGVYETWIHGVGLITRCRYCKRLTHGDIKDYMEIYKEK